MVLSVLCRMGIGFNFFRNMVLTDSTFGDFILEYNQNSYNSRMMTTLYCIMGRELLILVTQSETKNNSAPIFTMEGMCISI